MCSYVKRMEESKVERALIIVQQGITAFAKQVSHPPSTAAAAAAAAADAPPLPVCFVLCSRCRRVSPKCLLSCSKRQSFW